MSHITHDEYDRKLASHTRWVDEVFLGEIEVEASYCLAAASAVDRALNLEDPSVKEAFRSLHSLLTHAAMISKLLWPPIRVGKSATPERVTRMKERAQRLLDALSLPPDVSATLANRELRNSLEHFDERLDDWGSAGPTGLIDRNIGPPQSLANFDSAMKLRHYDPGTATYLFSDKPFAIPDIVKAARAVLERVPQGRQKLNPLSNREDG